MLFELGIEGTTPGRNPHSGLSESDVGVEELELLR